MTQPSTADELRRKSYELYRRSDNVPLYRDGTGTGIDRVAELREEADALIKKADLLDTIALEG